MPIDAICAFAALAWPPAKPPPTLRITSVATMPISAITTRISISEKPPLRAGAAMRRTIWWEWNTALSPVGGSADALAERKDRQQDRHHDERDHDRQENRHRGRQRRQQPVDVVLDLDV